MVSLSIEKSNLKNLDFFQIFTKVVLHRCILTLLQLKLPFEHQQRLTDYY